MTEAKRIREQLGVDQNVLLAPQAPQPEIIDSTMFQAMTLNGIFSVGDCAKIILDNTPEVWEDSAVNAAVDDDSIVTKVDWRDSKNVWLERSEKNMWLFDKMLALVMAANKEYRFEVDYFEALQLAKYEEGCFYDWHTDIGPGHMGNRKISVTVQLSSPDDYEGGELVLDQAVEEDFVAPNEIGSVTVFPAFMKHKVTPVTKGTRYSLVVWASGTHRFR